ncbi:MAG TPA: sigma-70 family RNA polymerase sigma factor [Actinomycetota bacterium]|nr:sigma-70 family RNA polymerase sigma factor [Actinomycetota bacterium]
MLAEQALSHRQDRFESLYRRYYWSLVGFCRGSLRSRAAAEDAAQEAFFRAYRYLEALDPSRSAWPWLKAIARNVIADRARRDARETPVEAPEAAPITNTDRAESSLALTEAMSTLPPRHRLALYLRYVEGLDPTAAAQRLDVSIAAFNQLLFRARSRLKAELRRLGEAVPALLAWPAHWMRGRAQRLSARAAGRSPVAVTRFAPEILLQVASGFIAVAVIFGGGGWRAASAGESQAEVVAQLAASNVALGSPVGDSPRAERTRAWESARLAAVAQSTHGAATPSGGGGGKAGGSIEVVKKVQEVASDATRKARFRVSLPGVGLPDPAPVVEKAKGVVCSVACGGPSAPVIVEPPSLPLDLPVEP